MSRHMKVHTALDAQWERWILANFAAGNTIEFLVEHLLERTGDKLHNAPSALMASPKVPYEDIIIENFRTRMGGKTTNMSEVTQILQKLLVNASYQEAKAWMGEHLNHLPWFHTRLCDKGKRGPRKTLIIVDKLEVMK